ncbi:nickel pincer cofactor biosynthesis protein LarB [Tepidibacter sp. Z1-5]|uniref:nickel pincer cofactor biosynthesis protein LarB n=1 Tax=Tepidibacter sp. Z1-5 TaxID=3134138 RepID=UPI0030BF850B
MDINNLKNLLLNIKEGKVDVDTALEDLKTLPFEDLGYAKIDHHRSIRNGYPEVIYCEGKTDEHIIGIVEKMYEKKSNILGTRAKKETYEKLKKIYPNCEYEELGRIIKIQNKPIENIGKGTIVVVTGGTSDIPVADEAYHTAKFLGNEVERLYDVGVAGIHRLLNNRDVLMKARVIIAVAGMEGALPSVVGGLVDVPVIAVPTSVGYGANFNGLSALLTMLNSCASGISVVNIDNGFGAGYLSSMINKL